MLSHRKSNLVSLEYLNSHATDYNIDPVIFQNWNTHIHVPEGATAKDGPSAGVTMFTS